MAIKAPSNFSEMVNGPFNKRFTSNEEIITRPNQLSDRLRIRINENKKNIIMIFL